MKSKIINPSNNWFGNIFADTSGDEPPVVVPPPDGEPDGAPEPPINSGIAAMPWV